MTTKALVEYFILGLPYMMAAVFMVGAFFRLMIWYTVKRHEWFARQFELRVGLYIEKQLPGQVKDTSFYFLTKQLLERTYYEIFAVRDRLQRRRGDRIMALSDRIFLVKQGCAWLVKDLLNQVKFLKWTEDTPKLQQITRATLSQNPCFNKVFGLWPITGVNDMVNILPGLFVIAGILGTFVGIAGGLQELGGMNLTDLDNSKNVMDRFLQEIAFAEDVDRGDRVLIGRAHLEHHVFPERVYVSLVERMETTLDLIWYRCDNNKFPSGEKAFDEHRDPIEALAEDAVNVEVKRVPKSRMVNDSTAPKAS